VCRIHTEDSMTCSRYLNRSANASTKISGGLRSLPLTCEHCYPSVVARSDGVVLLGDDSLGKGATPQVAGARRSQDPGLPKSIIQLGLLLLFLRDQ
jgi:hypothetical protein